MWEMSGTAKLSRMWRCSVLGHPETDWGGCPVLASVRCYEGQRTKLLTRKNWLLLISIIVTSLMKKQQLLMQQPIIAIGGITFVIIS